MSLFSFDKFWNIQWMKESGYLFVSKFCDFIITANKERVSSPVFAIYRDKMGKENMVAHDLTTDLLIMQLKSIKETGKILVK